MRFANHRILFLYMFETASQHLENQVGRTVAVRLLWTEPPVWTQETTPTLLTG